MSWPVAIRPPCENGIIRRTVEKQRIDSVRTSYCGNVPADRTIRDGNANAEASAPAFLSRPEELELLCHSD